MVFCSVVSATLFISVIIRFSSNLFEKPFFTPISKSMWPQSTLFIPRLTIMPGIIMLKIQNHRFTYTEVIIQNQLTRHTFFYLFLALFWKTFTPESPLSIPNITFCQDHCSKFKNYQSIGTKVIIEKRVQQRMTPSTNSHICHSALQEDHTIMFLWLHCN